jgi:hypothetical protein
VEIPPGRCAGARRSRRRAGERGLHRRSDQHEHQRRAELHLHAHCVATGGARVIREVTLGPSATVSQCLDECTRTLGCTQVSYRTTVEMRDGVPLVRMACTLMGAGEATTMDVPPAAGRATGVCTRDPALYRHPEIEVDARVRQDSFRPNIPIQPPTAPSPNKP